MIEEEKNTSFINTQSSSCNNCNIDPQETHNINFKQTNNTKPITFEKSFHNPFNQAQNSTYMYKDRDIEILAKGIMKDCGLNSDNFIGVKEYLDLNEDQINLFRANADSDYDLNQKLFGIYKINQHYLCFVITKQHEYVTCLYKNSLGTRIEKLEDEFLKIKKENILFTVEFLEEGKVDEYTESSSYIFALKNLPFLINGPQNFYTPNSLKGISDTREELGKLYLKYIINKNEKWKEWNNCEFSTKEKILSESNPLTEDQFQMVTKVNDPQGELQELLLNAITNQKKNISLAKLVLKAGLIVNNGIKNPHTQNITTFISILDNEKTKYAGNSKELEELKKIEKLLTKYGCEKDILISNKIPLASDKIKEYEYYEILKEVATKNNVPIEILKDFQTQFEARFDTIKTNIQGNNYKLDSSTTNLIKNSIIDKIPVVGKIYTNLIKNSDKAKAEEISNYLGESQKIIRDFCIRVIRHYAEEILYPNESYESVDYLEKLLKKVKEDSVVRDLKEEIIWLDKAIGTNLFSDESNEREFKYGDKDYTRHWKKLIPHYIEKFIEFIFFTIEAKKNFACKDSFGASAAKFLFEYHKVNKEELHNLTKSFCLANVKTFAKLSSYTSEIQKYPRSLALGKENYWCDTKNQLEQTGLNIQSVIIANDERIIICFNASLESYKTDNSKFTSEISGIKISSDLKEKFYKFYNNANYYYYSSIDDSIKKKGLGVILEGFIQNYPNANIFLCGHKLGGVLASMTYLHLYTELSDLASECIVIPDNVNIYTYGDSEWCAPDSVEVANKLFKNYFQITSIEDTVIQHNIGKKYYLKEGKLLHETLFEKKDLEEKTKGNKRSLIIKEYIDILDKTECLLENIHYNDEVKENHKNTSEDIKNGIMLADFAKAGNFEKIKYLIEEEGFDVDSLTNKKRTVLSELLFYMFHSRWQVEKNNDRVKIIKYLVEKGAKINQRSEESSSNYEAPIHWAAKIGNLELVKWMIEKGADPSFKDSEPSSNGRTALYYAVESQNLDLVKFLVEEKKLSVNEIDEDGETPLSTVIDNFDMSKYLIEKGADLNSNAINGVAATYPPLNRAARDGDIRLIKFLLEKGADINIKCPRGETPLHTSAYNRSLNAFKYLVDHGADITILDADKNSPLKIILRDQETCLDIFLYTIILRLQGKLRPDLKFKEFKEKFDHLISNGCNFYSISTYFVTEYIKINHSIKEREKLGKSLGKEEKLKLDQEKEYLEDWNQLFDGDDKIQIYNRLIKLLFDTSNPKRHLEVLKQCEESLKKFPKDEDILFLKDIVFVSQISQEFDSEKKEYISKKFEHIKEESALSLYILGEIKYFQGLLEDSLTYYRRAIKLDNYFLNPKIRIISILLKKSNLSELELMDLIEYKKHVNKAILSLDCQFMMDQINEIIETKDFMKLNSARQIKNQEFGSALKAAFVEDVLKISEKLKDNFPDSYKSLKKDIKYKNKPNESFNVDTLLYNIDYGYDLVIKTAQKDFVLKEKNDLFFNNINEITEKLESYKDVVETRFTPSSFKDKEVTKEEYINLIDDILNYYDNYKIRVLRDYRDYQSKPDTNYLTTFKSGRGKYLDVKKSISVYTEKSLEEYQDGSKEKTREISQPYLLKRYACDHLTITEPKSAEKYGTNPVVVWPQDGDNKVYYKYMPHAPGIEFAVSSLYGLILPNTTPETMLVKLTDGKSNALYLASKAASGKNFKEVMNQPEILKTIEPSNFSGLFISSFLVCTGDAKPDNFIMHFNYNDSQVLKYSELISIDNDIAFCRHKLSVFTDKNNNQRKLYSDMLNILYLLPQMKDIVSPNLREYLLRAENQSEIIISKWLGGLYRKNELYNKLVDLERFTKEDLEKLKLPIKLPEGTANKIYSLLNRILKLLKSETVTHNDIFKSLSPGLAYFYEKHRDYTSIENSLKNLYVQCSPDPSIVRMLYSTNTLSSINAWKTLSSSKRKELEKFKEFYKSEIVEETQKFLAVIDFRLKDDQVISSFNQNLNFFREVELNKINNHQLELLLKNINFKNPKKITIKDAVMTQEEIEKIKKNYLNLVKFEFKNTSKSTSINIEKNSHLSEQVLELNINSIWDLMDNSKRPTKKELNAKEINDRVMKTIQMRNIDINQTDSEGNTLLHQAVLNGDLIIIEILLDCGIDKNIQNKEGKKAIDLSESNPEIIIKILDHKPLYFQQLLDQGRVEEAEIIAKSINPSCNTELIDGDLIGQERSIIQQVLSDRKFRMVALIIFNKIEEIKENYLHLFTSNYSDEDLNILELIISKSNDKNLLESLDDNRKLAADIALDNKKYNILCTLINKGSRLTKKSDSNLDLIMKAAKWKFIINKRDFESGFDYDKRDANDNTIFHLMCKEKDKEILKYEHLLEKYKNIKNNENKNLYDLALEVDFIPLLELLYPDQSELYDKDGMHKLAKGSIKEMSKILKKVGFEISIEEARMGIDLYTKIDKKGNTVLQRLIKKYIISSTEENFKDIGFILEYSSKHTKDYTNFTRRPDGNTALHIATRAGRSNLIEILSKCDDLTLVCNSQHETALDLATKYFSFNKKMQDILEKIPIKSTQQTEIFLDEDNYL